MNITKKILLISIVIIVSFFGISSLNAEAKPKNIILFISDGMGYNHITAANYFLYGNGNAIYENFPVKLAMATYPGFAEKDNTYTYSYSSELYWSDFEYAKEKPTDSGAASTAMATGKKTYRHAIGVDLYKNPQKNLSELFKEQNKAAGVISTVPFSHATPAGFVAHHTDRNEYDIIANQMIESDVEVIIGSGHPYYDNDGNKKETPDFEKVGSEENWKKLKNDYKGRKFIETKEDFEKYSIKNTPERVFGLAQTESTLQESRTKNENNTEYKSNLNDNVPSLETMTVLGLKALSQNYNGFFVMIEGGAVDWASHDNNTIRMIEEMEDFNKAVEAAVKWVEENSSWDETLMIVTSDHECGYLTGPEEEDNNPDTNPVINNGKGELPGVKWCHDSHTTALVPFYAKGINSDIFYPYAYSTDKVYGDFIENTHVPIAIFNLYK